MIRRISRALAHSPALARGRRLWNSNQTNWQQPLTKVDKLLAGIYIILEDTAKGQFPPTFSDQQKAYDAEIAYRHSLPGLNADDVATAEMRKPFWFGRSQHHYLGNLLRMADMFDAAGVRPPARLLELGCSSGWMSEAFAQMGFSVVGTTISPEDVHDASRRVDAMQLRRIPVDLQFRATPMESVAAALSDLPRFDGAFVHEALHHAYDWRAALYSIREVLNPGGWLVIASEPNMLHTLSSYRIARLSNTHEIGFSRGELITALKAAGYTGIKVASPKLHFWALPHWIVSRRPDLAELSS
jgi:2-polyprenyl-3-methyl-5-hydroxy-6-metoxy-1,4-benzoquinol methylase